MIDPDLYPDRGDPNPDSLDGEDTVEGAEPLRAPDDDRSDIEQAVMARSDAVARGEGGVVPDGDDGTGGAGGVVKNQDDAAQ